MGSIVVNNLQRCVASKQLCRIRKAFGIRLVPNPQIVQLVCNAGFDSFFIDLEHSTLSLKQTSTLCSAGLQLGITPFVRVPHQCGDGFVQRVLDGGALGVIFPHIHNKADVQAAVSISKYPPIGKRSMTGQLPAFQLLSTPGAQVIEETNARGSSVVLMIETKESIDRMDEIASAPGVEMLLVGSNDLSIELGVTGQFKSPEFRAALEAVSAACKRHGVAMGLAGIYENAELHEWAVKELDIGYILGQQDSGLLARSSVEVVRNLETVVSGSK